MDLKKLLNTLDNFMTLRTENQKALEIRLLELKKHAEQALKKLDTELDFGSDIDGGDEESDETEERTNQIGVRNALKTQLDRVQRALERIDDGKYGICTSCGEEIDMELLTAVPESDLCRNCKLKQ